MKKLLLIAMLIVGQRASAQTIWNHNYITDPYYWHQYGYYFTATPDGYVDFPVFEYTDTTYYKFWSDTVIFDCLNSTHNSGTPTNIIWAASDGMILRSPVSSLPVISNTISTATLNFPSTSAGSQSDTTFAYSGAVDGDIIALGVVDALQSVTGVIYKAWVSASNMITVRFRNDSGITVDPASATFKIKLIK